MATFYLLNTTVLGTTKYFAGRLVDDSVDPKADLVAAGGQCWPSSDGTEVATAAALVATLRFSKAINESTADFIMLAAAAESNRANHGTGATGATGTTGATGSTGATGTTGSTGATGATGAAP